MNILVTTGIYPPHIGGPSQYAKRIVETWRSEGHTVRVATYGSVERALPIGCRHLYFFLKILLPMVRSDVVFALDTFSVGLPTVAAGLVCGKKVTIRTGGDFLWEAYVERTGDPVLLRNFYSSETLSKLSRKENIIKALLGWTLRNAHRVVFSTEFQRAIFVPAYRLQTTKTAIVENYYAPHTPAQTPVRSNQTKEFIASSRPLKLKNIDTLLKAFDEANIGHAAASLITGPKPFEEFVKLLSSAQAFVLVSISEISPNAVLDALRAGVPCIVTKENGILNRIGNHVLLVDPLNQKEIENAISIMADDVQRSEWRAKALAFNFSHSWKEVCSELLAASGT